jgi:hypothetical protein
MAKKASASFGRTMAARISSRISAQSNAPECTASVRDKRSLSKSSLIEGLASLQPIARHLIGSADAHIALTYWSAVWRRVWFKLSLRLRQSGGQSRTWGKHQVSRAGSDLASMSAERASPAAFPPPIVARSSPPIAPYLPPIASMRLGAHGLTAGLFYQPCFATRLGGVSGGKETQGWRDSSHTAMVGAGKFGSAKLPMATATYPGKPSLSQ